MSQDYSVELQRLYLEILLTDHDLFVRCNGILEPAYFDRTLRPSVQFLQEYVEEYGSMPDQKQIEAKTALKLDDVSGRVDDMQSWFLDDFEQFCRHKALEAAILNSADKLENKEYGAVEHLIREAVGVGLAKELGMDYWEDPTTRLQRIMDRKGGTSTGWTTFDKFLYGGFNRGELNIFAGGSGAGKSLFLQNLALNWSQVGFNVVYISLELSEDLCSMRVDSMLTGYSTKQLFKNLSDVDLKVKMASRNAGRLQFVQLPNGITVNDIKAYIKEYQIQNNIKVDAVLVDYLDLMTPAKVKISGDNVFLKDKHVSEELRNLSMEGDYLFATASQLNRGAVDEIEFDHSHISGGLSKIQTADNVIGIFASRAMRERGMVQIQFMKTRSSSGVGQKLDLALDLDSLRISDLPEDAQDAESATASSLYDRIQKGKAASNHAQESAANDGVVGGLDNTEKLRNILKRQD